MRRWLLAVGLAATATASIADSPPPDLVATFIELCGETHGDPVRALAAADRNGWSVPPALGLHPPLTFGSSRWTHLDGRFLRSPGEVRVLEVGTQANPRQRSAVSCAIIERSRRSASAADLDRMRDALARWVGGQPVKTSAAGNYAQFAFREVAGQRRRLLPGDRALSADLPPPDVAEVSLGKALGMPLITYVNVR